MKKQIHTYRILVLGIVFFLVTNFVNGQIFPQLGAERAGISALTFLKLETSAKSEAMAGAQISLEGDGFSASWNPATMTELKEKTIALSDRVMQAGIMNSYASAIFPLKNHAALGFSLTNLNSGEIEKTTVFQPNGTGEYVSYQDFALGVSYSKILSDYFSLGVSAKYVREQMAGFYDNTVAIDLGFLYNTGYKDLRFAVFLQGFGPNSTLGGNLPPLTFVPAGVDKLSAYQASGVFKMGISIVPIKTDFRKLTLALQVNHPTDNAENISLGVEYMVHKIFFLRAGYRINVRDQNYPTAGVGILTHIGRSPLHIDYAVSAANNLSLAHTIGISIQLKKENSDVH